MNTKNKEVFDMQRTLLVYLIDDDHNIVSELNQRFQNVIFESFDIERIIRRINRGRVGVFEKSDLIFIDTFYKDDKSDYYALDFFQNYREMDSETKSETQGKYYVLVGIDDVNQRLKSQTSQDIDVVSERTRLMQLMGKVRKQPYIEWGAKRGSKTQKISETIEQYCTKNKIYLYKKKEMSFDEWLNYIIFFIQETETLISEAQQAGSSYDELTSNINCLRTIVAQAREKLKLSESGVGNLITIKQAIDFTDEYNRAVGKHIHNLMVIGVKYSNNRLMELAHHFSNLNCNTSDTIEEQNRMVISGENR